MTATEHEHSFRAHPGAGWKCVGCGRWTVSRPPKELTASYQERLRTASKNRPMEKADLLANFGEDES